MNRTASFATLLAMTLSVSAYAQQGSPGPGRGFGQDPTPREKPDATRQLVPGSGLPASDLYEQGLKAMQRGNWDKAILKFRELRNFHRDDPLSVKAQLALADIQFERGNFEEARYAYEEFATYHPRHESLDHVTFQIGMSIWKRAPKWAGRDQTTTRTALNSWSSFEARFPESGYTEQVHTLMGRGNARLASKVVWIGRFYQKKRQWPAVYGRGRELRATFPGSRYETEAMAMMAMAAHHMGRPDEADSLLEQMRAAEVDTSLIRQVERELRRDPEAQGAEAIFLRPYRIPSGAQPTPGPGGGPAPR